jgi:hypothetical protein
MVMLFVMIFTWWRERQPGKKRMMSMGSNVLFSFDLISSIFAQPFILPGR